MMLSRTGHVVVSNGIGIGLMIIGWYISILNVALSRSQAIFSAWTLLGLCLIVVGAYMPRLWTKITNS